MLRLPRSTQMTEEIPRFRDETARKALLLVGLAVLLSACPSGGIGQEASNSGARGDPAYDLVDASGWTVFTSRAHRLSLSHPGGWRVLDEGIDPTKRNAVRAVVLASNFEIPDGGYCAHAPVEGLENLPDDGIILTVHERSPDEVEPVSTVGFDPKPARFGPWLGSIDGSVADCLDGPAPFAHWFLNFQMSGRAFHVLVVFGPRTPPSAQAAAWHVLDSFVAEKA